MHTPHVWMLHPTSLSDRVAPTGFHSLYKEHEHVIVIVTAAVLQLAMLTPFVCALITT